MNVPKKHRYALRALFELAQRFRSGPIKVAEIAEAQDIPARFLEIILGQLKRGGFVESRRGNEGGYLLARPPRRMTVGEVMRFLEGPAEEDPLQRRDACADFWDRVAEAIREVYETTTLQNLVEEAARTGRRVLDFAI